MRRLPSQSTMLALSLIAIAGGGWAFYKLASFTSRAGASAPLYSTERFDPYGSAALKAVLERRGRPVRSLNSPRQLREARGVLVQVLPMRERAAARGRAPASDYRLSPKRLKRWIADGNTVLQLTRRHTELMRELGLPPRSFQAGAAQHVEMLQRRGEPPDRLSGSMRDYALTDELADGRSAGADHLALRQARVWPARALETGSFEPIAGSRSGWAALRRGHGDGSFIVIGAPTPVLNQFIRQGANLETMLAVIEGALPQRDRAAVWFDAWSLGMGHPGTLMGLVREFYLLPALLQVGLVIAVWHWANRGRHAVPPAAPARRRSSAQQLQTLGLLYRRAMPGDELARRAYEIILTRVAAALGWRRATIESSLGLAGQARSRSGPEAGGIQQRDPRTEQARELVAAARRLVTRFPIRCRQCRYNLRGSERGQCPECGEPVTPQQRQQLAVMPTEREEHEASLSPQAIEKEAIRLLDRSSRLLERGRKPRRRSPRDNDGTRSEPSAAAVH